VPDAIDALKNLLGPDGIISDPADMSPYLTSMRNRHVAASPLVVLPRSTEQVATIVRICRDHNQPLIPQGGNTGLVDGAIPDAGQNAIILSLSRMNAIRAIDAVGATMIAEAGAILQNVQDAATAAGFLFPLSMASEGSMQIGGAIGTNAGGTAVVRYGTTRNLVLGLEAVLADGSIISNLKALPKDNTGYNLSQLLIGAEGTLGIVTAASLRLFPTLRHSLTAIVAVADAAAAVKFFTLLRQEAAEILTTFEIMSVASVDLVRQHFRDTRFPRVNGAGYYLLIGLGASSMHMPLTDIFVRVAGNSAKAGQIMDVVIAKSEAEAKQFWHLREHIPESLRKQGNRIHFDIALPLAGMVDFLNDMPLAIHAVAADMVLMPFGHIGDGNLHYNMYTTATRTADDFATLKKHIQDLVFAETHKRGGSISAEHGIGIERKAVLAALKSVAELDVMRRIKHALDPHSIMNPGKVFD
jgi:D-lactate dehydrogenase (cytochrome)